MNDTHKKPKGAGKSSFELIIPINDISIKMSRKYLEKTQHDKSIID